MNMEKPCDHCKTPTHYEPIFLGETDMCAILPHLCETCAATRREEIAEAEKAAVIAKARETYEHAVPPKLRETDIAHPDYNRSAHNAIHHAYAMDSRRNILCYGSAGLCKSRVLARLCARAAFEGHSVAWITSHDFALLADRFQSYKTRDAAHDQIDILKRVSRLVFDDIGKHAWSSKIEEIFFTVVDFRYSRNKPTWFSCNTHPAVMLENKEFSLDRGASIVGRIVEMAHEFKFEPKPKP